jgi:NAD(P)-dependent dehydrogenase (short-subunit alcohol dehydrogenase family)
VVDVINTNLIGTINAIQVALPHLKEGASIIATGSTAALMDAHQKDNPGATRRHVLHGRQAPAVELRSRPGHRTGGAGHPRQRRTPDQLQHRHAAERADV